MNSLGGIKSFTKYLIREIDEPNEIVLIDKFAINENYSSTYLDNELKDLLLHKSNVKYFQFNLLNTSRLKEFLSTLSSIDFVIDLTVDMNFNSSALLHIQSSLISYNLGKLLSNYSIKSYLKLSYPFYHFNNKPSDENDNLIPHGDRGVWSHQSLYSLATIPNLPLVILRIGAWYGDHEFFGKITPRLICAHIYHHLNEDMKFLWSDNLQLNTIHIHDVARAIIQLSYWRSSVDNSTLQSTLNDVRPHADKQTLQQFNLPIVDSKVKAPLFNIVDDSNATQSSVADKISSFFNIKITFLGNFVSTFAQADIDQMVDDVNEKHLEAWNDMLKLSGISDTPLTPYLDEHFFKKNPISLDNNKIKSYLNFTFIHDNGLTINHIKQIVDGFKENKLWPQIN